MSETEIPKGIKVSPVVTTGMVENRPESGAAAVDSVAEGKEVTECGNCGAFKCPTCERTDFKSSQGVIQHHAKVHGESIAGIKSKCATCNSEIRIGSWRFKGHGKHHCSYACVQGGSAEIADYVCEYCGDSFTRSKKHVNGERVFCSQKCTGHYYGEKRKKKRIVMCEYCDEPTEKSNYQIENNDKCFCSTECHGNWLSDNMSGENSANWKGGFDGYYGGSWNRQRKKALERDGYICQICRVTKDDHPGRMHVHHIKKYRHFDDHNVANKLDNLITLCDQCHNGWEGIPLKPEVINNA